MARLNYQRLVCIVAGHRDEQITLQLGKLNVEEVRASKCQRCGRVSMLKFELAKVTK